MNVAVGGNFFNDYCTYADESRNKPWKWKSATAMRDFWEAKDNWYPTWDVESENNALQVDYVRVYALDMNNIGNYHWYQTDQSNDINWSHVVWIVFFVFFLLDSFYILLVWYSYS